MMKKIFAGFLAAVMSVMTVGCRQNSPNEPTVETEEDTTLATAKTTEETVNTSVNADTPLDEETEDAVVPSDNTASKKSTEAAPSTTVKAVDTKKTEASTKTGSVSTQTVTETTAAANPEASGNSAGQPIYDESVEDLDLITPAPAVEPTVEETHESPLYDRNGNEEL